MTRIGNTITITESKNNTNITGKIIDETKNTITIETNKGPKKIIITHITKHEEST